MKTFTVKKLPDEPIIISTMSAEYSVTRDMQASDNAARDLLDEFGEQMYLIVDITNFKVSIDDVTLGSSRGARDGESPLWHHQRIKQVIFVSKDKVVHLAAKGVNSLPFGFLNIKVFNTLEKALVFCRTTTGA